MHEPQIDKMTGAALGIHILKFSTHAEARTAAAVEDGKTMSLVGVMGVKSGGEEPMRVVLDGEGKALKAARFLGAL